MRGCVGGSVMIDGVHNIPLSPEDLQLLVAIVVDSVFQTSRVVYFVVEA